jgi:hypothetical protein
VITITRFACAYYIKLSKLNREKHNHRNIETKRNKRKRKTNSLQKGRKKEIERRKKDRKALEKSLPITTPECIKFKFSTFNGL